MSEPSPPTMEGLVQAFCVARDTAEGHATSVHAGLAAVLDLLAAACDARVWAEPAKHSIYAEELETIVENSRPQSPPPRGTN